MKKNVLGFLLILFSASLLNLNAQQGGVDAQYRHLLEGSDHFRSYDGSDITFTMTMLRTDPDEGAIERTMKNFRRDSDNAFVSVTLSPESYKGQGILRVGDNIWRYDPESDQFTHIALDSSFEGSDARQRDMQRPTLADDYTIVGATDGTLGNFSVTILELEANRADIEFVTQTVYIDQSSGFMLKVESFGASGTLMRSAYYLDYQQVGGLYFSTNTIFVDELVENKRTQIRITGISTDDLPNSVFNKAYLESISR